MRDQFSFYDIVAHIIPGALALIVIYWFWTDMLALRAPIMEINDIGDSILILIASYLLGSIIQGIGEGIEERLRSADSGKKSSRLKKWLKEWLKEWLKKRLLSESLNLLS